MIFCVMTDVHGAVIGVLELAFDGIHDHSRQAHILCQLFAAIAGMSMREEV